MDIEGKIQVMEYISVFGSKSLTGSEKYKMKSNSFLLPILPKDNCC